MNPSLQNIISVYADLWADVLYNRRLRVHLQKLENDIAFISMLIKLAQFNHNEPVGLIKIRQQLVAMSNIIKERIANTS